MIALVGPPGSGKTTVGAALAERLGTDFIDHDAAVAGRHGDIAGIVLDDGPDRLATLQADLLEELAGADVVLAVGSAALDDPRSARALRGAVVVHLAADLAHTFPRSGLNRPQPPGLVGARQLWARLLAERDAAYRAVADHVVEVGDLTVDEVVDAVFVLLPTGGPGELG
ncbi:MAG: AAA family ATPase [Actinomycetes bacterium]|nr:AAA family ATPase [Actinomycetes bacterium]MDX5380902.1 AAA family ATPase [Actinomycetes bacterium]MDX5399992.1 AAA family ATPase [Actinomycetes bacterium]MDX5450656.1 AAA family ATPase [Actinomycetes bacterium]